MPNAHGGYRKPTHSAPVSGPGALSKRTDGQVQAAPTGMAYGDHQALMAQESTAPMSADPSTPTPNIPAPQRAAASAPGGAPAQPRQPITPIGAPSQRPNEPVTAGVDIGTGPGSEVLPMQHTGAFQAAGPMTQMLGQLSASDQSGVLSTLLQFARSQGA